MAGVWLLLLGDGEMRWLGRRGEEERRKKKKKKLLASRSHSNLSLETPPSLSARRPRTPALSHLRLPSDERTAHAPPLTRATAESNTHARTRTARAPADLALLPTMPRAPSSSPSPARRARPSALALAALVGALACTVGPTAVAGAAQDVSGVPGRGVGERGGERGGSFERAPPLKLTTSLPPFFFPLSPPSRPRPPCSWSPPA